MRRSLALKREHLAELSSDELSSVAAGRAALPTLAYNDCLYNLSVSCPGASCGCCTASASC